MTKRILALVLSIAMVLSFIPVMAFADDTTADPYTTGLNDNASYLMKVPSQSDDYTIVTENGENFIKPSNISSDGFGEVTINASKFTFGTDTGLPEDYPLSDDADASKLWVALRIKIKDNNPAYSPLSASVRMYFDIASDPFNNILGPKATSACRWLDLKDGSMTWAYPWSASYISSSNWAEFEFSGDMDGYLLIPLKHNFSAISSIKKFDGFSFRFYNGSSVSSKKIKKSSWANKEFLLGDSFLVTEGTDSYDLSAFQTAHTQGIEKYAPNGAEDSAYYSLRVGGYRTLFFNAFAQSVSKNWYDTTAIRTSTGPVAHITTLSNGDRAFEFNVNKDTDGVTAMDYSTPIDIPAADTYDHYKGYKTNMMDLNDQVGKGVPEEIDLTNLRTLAFRVATKDGSVENETIKFSYGVGTTSTPYRLSANANVTYLDINNGTITTMTADADGNLTVDGNLDGYIIIPIDSFSAELTAEAIKAGWNYHSYTSSSRAGSDKSSNELYLVSGFDNGKAFYYGDVYFVGNAGTFVQYHASCETFGHEYKVTDSKVPSDEEDGYNIYTCQRLGCGDIYTEVITCLHENAVKQNVVEATCTEAGYSGDLYCPDCKNVIEQGEATEALGHKETQGEGKEPTCTEVGYEISISCERCTEFLIYEGEIPEIPHKYEGEGTVVEPTEDNSGYTEYTCDYGCGAIKKTDYVMPFSSEVKNVKGQQITGTMDLRITWDAIEGADRYLVFVFDKDGTKVGGVTVRDGAKTSAVVSSLKVGNYTVYVRARVGGKYTAKYDSIEAAIGSIIPKAPVVRILKTDKRSVIVTWDAVEDVVKYFVRFESKNKTYTSSVTENYLELDGLKLDTEYKISVNAKLGVGKYTGYGEAITAKTEQHTDVELSAALDEDEIVISWNASIAEGESADKYWIYRVDADGKWNLFKVTTETSITIKSTDNNSFGVIARVNDAKGIRHYVESKVVEARDPSLLTYTPVDTEGMTDLQKAVVLTAENYVLHGNRVQYEDTRINGTTSRNQWRWGYIKTNTLESYTSQNIRYSNCAAWTHEAYWNALDFDVVQYQTAQWCNIAQSSDSRILLRLLKGNGDFDTEAKRLALEKQIRKMLQPGDLVVYTRDSGTGHVMMYVGNNMMIHCTGSSFSWTNKLEKHETSGAIRYESCEQWFTPGHSRYLFDTVGTETVLPKQRVAIVRPLNTFTGTIPQKTLDRMTTMRGVVSEKLASVDPNVTVNVGDEITYTFRFSNYSDVDKTFNVTDVVPANTTYVSGAESRDGDNLSWNVTVPAGKVAEVSYTVKVNDDAMGKTIYGTDAKVESISLVCHKIYVKKTLTTAEQNSILEAVESLKTSELRDIALADAIYKEAVDSAVLENATAADVMNGVFKNYQGTSGWPSRWQQKETVSNTFLSMLAPNMYGGRQVIDPDGKINVGQGIERTRLVVKENLVIGDIIVANNPETEVYTTTEYTFQPVTYMFLGDKLLNMTTMEEITLEATTLEPLMCERHFCVIRPSIAM